MPSDVPGPLVTSKVLWRFPNTYGHKEGVEALTDNLDHDLCLAVPEDQTIWKKLKEP